MQAEDYEGALPLLEQAVSKLAGTGSLAEAYASYNLAFTRLALGSCDGVLELLARSEEVQGGRSEIDRLRREGRRSAATGRGRATGRTRKTTSAGARALRRPRGSGPGLLREDELPVRQDVELRLRTRCGVRVDVERLGDLGRETRGPCVVPASGGAVQDLDAHTWSVPSASQAALRGHLGGGEGGDHTGARLAARRTQFPEWAHLPVRPVELDGWDNTTFRLGDSLSVRLPSADGYTAQVDKEQRWLPFLAPQLPLSGSRLPRLSGTPGLRILRGRGRCTAGSTASTATAVTCERSRPVRDRPGRLPDGPLRP